MQTLAGWCRRVILLSLVLPAVALAVEVPTLFTAEVPYERDARDPRGLAYRYALTEILQRVSGSEVASDRQMVDELFPDPAVYVMQFRPGANNTLWVSFDGQAIERTLRSAGQTYWGADRPLTLVWVAVDWGQGRREIVAADDPERRSAESRSIDRNRRIRERILEVADRRGLPLIFPLLDSTDLQGVDFADIWGGFDEAVLEASRRYSVNSILIGRVRPGSGQRDRWTYHFGGGETSLGGSPESVLGRVADMLAAEFAIAGDTPVEVIALNVAGVTSIAAYGEVHRMLRDVPHVENFAVTEVVGDRVSYRVEVRGGAARLGRVLRFGGLIEQDEPELLESPADLEYFYPR
ncbi:MAG: DUF2066 domain-containing protein [Gammaproteobacteria bacterium]|nr:DUF2066 domain-containing protein [Gammaproteobacteria bacterium]MBT8104251.1 DUF2066 domain-containing protein [Gammaproteobacteria bacterium]NNF49090.1 DUF2066 domain-containing protein [Woeseiaceae bacterium]NNK24266.1 DUF2066 domain-containing protein [Woeseiaceae bacterium]NNL63847.1 DUF2066 domain-containing protein [Woeseiaceae bacterium]